jgi:ABC-type transport system involved in multi-copper enzyme maturation permease subunit
MIQAYTILLDSLRMLRASKLFWVSLWISALVAVIYGSIGFTPRGMSVGFGLFHFDMPLIREGSKEAEAFYLLIFTDLIARFWLGWFSLVLAIISTCSIFPQFLQSGSIELALSKPVSRLRLFLLKYLGGLLFVAVQTTLFCIVAFVAIGLRLEEWSISIFWAVPIITFAFSLIYCVGVLIGVLTRSTVFALLGALLFWSMTLVAQWTEDFVYKMAYVMPEMGMTVNFATGQVEEAQGDSANGWKNHYSTIQTVTRILPKTRECTLSLKRLIRFKERASLLSGLGLDAMLAGEETDPIFREAMKKYELRHSWFSLVGSSVIFEILVLGLAATIFIRRDY